MASEKRLIDAVALENRIYDSKVHNSHMDFLTARNHHYEHDHFLKMVRSAPTVDAVEVVRCGNCEYFNEPFCCRRDDEAHRERINMLTVDFCSYGKKQNGGADGGI